jgi:hypothetical protein
LSPAHSLALVESREDAFTGDAKTKEEVDTTILG